MHIVKLLQTWLIETEGNKGVIVCLGQGGLWLLHLVMYIYVKCESAIRVYFCYNEYSIIIVLLTTFWLLFM